VLGWDESTLRALNAVFAEAPGLTQLWWFIDAPVGAIFLILLLAGICVKKRAWRLMIVLGATAACADLLVSFGLKPLLARPRPCLELVNLIVPYGCGGAFGLPSGHATTSFAIAGVLNRRWMWAAAVISALSRVAIGVHYPTDVLVGAALGSSIGWMSARVFLKNAQPRTGTKSPSLESE